MPVTATTSPNKTKHDPRSFGKSAHVSAHDIGNRTLSTPPSIIEHRRRGGVLTRTLSEKHTLRTIARKPLFSFLRT